MHRARHTFARNADTRNVQLLWLLLAVISGGYFVVSPLTQWTALHTTCRPATCRQFQIDVDSLRALHQHGITLDMYVVAMLVGLLLIAMLWYGLSALIILRKPGDRGALFTAFFLCILPQWQNSVYVSNAFLSNVIGDAGITILLLFGFLFPSGRFVPRWSLWLTGVFVLLFVLDGNEPTNPILDGLALIAFVAVSATAVGAQIYRYRRVSSWAERQQTKWAIFGPIVAVVSLLLFWTVGLPLPVAQGPGSLIEATMNIVGVPFFVSAIPVCLSIAVLRNQLWDIDRVINRALVYTTLTVTLGGLYALSVVGLQALLTLIVGHGSGIAVALSTIAIAAIFGPMRRQVQTGIDRRFYRRKYDVTRTLAALSSRLQGHESLEQVSSEVEYILAETMQPAHLSIWLRQ